MFTRHRRARPTPVQTAAETKTPRTEPNCGERAVSTATKLPSMILGSLNIIYARFIAVHLSRAALARLAGRYSYFAPLRN